AERLARTLDDRARLGQVSVHLCHLLRLAGDTAEAIAFGETAHTIAESLGELPLQVTANLYLGAACLWAGNLPRAKELAVQVLAREWNLSDLLVAAEGFLGHAYELVGRRGEGFPLLERALRSFEATGHHANQSTLLVLLAEACIVANKVEEALEFARRAVILA